MVFAHPNIKALSVPISTGLIDGVDMAGTDRLSIYQNLITAQKLQATVEPVVIVAG